MSSQSPGSDDPLAAFGPNEWLVDELYQQYLEDKNSVDEDWWAFFADYQPEGAGGPNGRAGDGAGPQRSSGSGTRQQAGPAQQGESTQSKPTQSKSTQATKAQSTRDDSDKAGNDKAGKDKAEQNKEKLHTKTEKSKAATKDVTSSDKAKGGARAEGQDDKGPVDKGSGDKAPADKGAGDEQSAPKPTPRDAPEPRATAPQNETEVRRLRGAGARVVTNMEASLEVPTATSVRSVPAKLLIDNRTVINNHLSRARGGKVSFTHIIGYAMVKATAAMPEMNNGFTEDDGKPALVVPAHINLGLAIDVPKSDGTRQLMVPSIKSAEEMDFAHFWAAYEDVVRKARDNKLTLEDFQGTTISLTNPGGIGTVHSVPRLMAGQGTIIAVGALDYPAAWQGASTEAINRNAVSKILTLTSTYDHRIIQGAQSGEYLKVLHQLLQGADGFYDEIFTSLRIPYEPIRWVPDISAGHEDDVSKTARVQELIHAYRVRGHLMADTDPLEYRQRRHPDLDITNHGLTMWDLDRKFATGGFGGVPRLTLRKVLGILRDTYCRTVGVEYMHIQDPEQRAWLQERLERPYAKVTADEQLRILRKLNAAEAFETFLQTKFVGQKRFSLEGGESVIALMDRIMCNAVEDGMDEVGIGMPHRGRLNVLANLAGKSYGQIFREFEGQQDPKSVQGSGDVKYHLGTEGQFTTDDGRSTKVYLAANPSHLEAVNPVLEGVVRAKQDRIDLAGEAFTVLPVLLHGDAAFAGQGVVAETLNLSQLRGYRTGGTIHVVINNQVGFTTGPAASRSSFYSTDVARMVQAPIFHVNGDDPEACVRVAELAYEFRRSFNKDVVIDLVCYRRRGHNEGDDPSMTQPLMYDLIEAKRSVRKLYTESLIGRGDISIEDAESALRDYQKQLEQVFTETREALKSGAQDGGGLEPPQAQQEDEAAPTRHTRTAVNAEDLQLIGDAFVNLPEGFTVHPKLQQLMEKRAQMTREGGVDWAMAEMLAFGTLLKEGTPVRLAGQDSRRGTFVQRHAVLTDKKTAEEWNPLLYLGDGQAKFWIYDSLLSEYAALGFEYGYSVERPDALVLWEAQFGDFINGAQLVVDEFISASEQKWSQRSSVVLLLPHGYEGQGPDHSSARIERFLQMCAEENMTVAYPSTPASYFHLLRKQAYARPRRPLIVFTPKSMLRLKAAASTVEDFTSGAWRPVLPDRVELDAEQVDRVMLASGKVVYELEGERKEREDERTAVIRVERLAPVPGKEIAEAVKAFGNAELVWVQDEPKNQGAWPYMALNLPEALAQHGEERGLRVVARPAAAAPSTGSSKIHADEQKRLLKEAFDR